MDARKKLSIPAVCALILSEKPRKKRTLLFLAPHLALCRFCCHRRSKLISHYRIWTCRQVQIFNLLDIDTSVHLSHCVFFTQCGRCLQEQICLWSGAFVVRAVGLYPLCYLYMPALFNSSSLKHEIHNEWWKRKLETAKGHHIKVQPQLHLLPHRDELQTCIYACTTHTKCLNFLHFQ